jgi:ABC-2 type transport system permease protein
MKTMQWLIRRELWEHKGSLLRAPLVVAALIVAITAAGLALGIWTGHNGAVSFIVNGHRASMGDMTAVTEGRLEHARVLALLMGNYIGSATPLFLMLGFIVFSYCVGALHNERRDRSLLFWKSLPVSDRDTVLSKAAIALVVAPAITLAAACVSSILILLLFCGAVALAGVNLFGVALTSPEVYLTPLRMFGLLPLYILWALPTVGWLLMVSAWARSKVLLWAVGIPLMAMVLVGWAGQAFQLDWNAAALVKALVTRLLLSIAPGSWLVFDQDVLAGLAQQGGLRNGIAQGFSASWQLLGTLNLWLGAAAGIVMLAVATWLRRWRDET